MFEIILNASLSAIISGLTLLMGYYVLTKKAEKMVEKQKNLIKSDVQSWLNSENGQKALYSIGALVGNGARTGIGLQTKSGKFKWQDLVGQIVGSYVQKNVLGAANQISSTSTPNTNSSANLKIE